MSYRPEPPMMPIEMSCIVTCGGGLQRALGWAATYDGSTYGRPFFLADDAGRDRRIVLEEDNVLAVDRLAHEALLVQERVHRIEVVAHHPGRVHVRGGRHEVGHVDRRPTAGLEPDELVVHGVAAGAPHAEARQHLAVLLDEAQDAGCLERHEVVREVAGPVALVRVRRVVPLAAADVVASRVESAGAGRRRPRAR